MGGKTKVLFKGAVWEVYEVWADRWAKDGGCIHIGLAERAKHQSARKTARRCLLRRCLS